METEPRKLLRIEEISFKYYTKKRGQLHGIYFSGQDVQQLISTAKDTLTGDSMIEEVKGRNVPPSMSEETVEHKREHQHEQERVAESEGDNRNTHQQHEN
ncbi:hypothetical protein COOONC_28667 [Cooperia oncophora]